MMGQRGSFQNKCRGKWLQMKLKIRLDLGAVERMGRMVLNQYFRKSCQNQLRQHWMGLVRKCLSPRAYKLD